jgi:hypothetical protein
MPRILEFELETVEVRDRWGCPEAARLEGAGADLIGLCPFHDDREPSLVVTPERTSGTASACQAGGSIDWIMRRGGFRSGTRRRCCGRGSPWPGGAAIDGAEAGVAVRPDAAGDDGVASRSSTSTPRR